MKLGRGMAILVTGGAGYIGSHMVRELCDNGENVVVLDNLSTGFRSAVPETVPFFLGDVADSALVSRILADHSVSTVIHFAGSAVVTDSVADPLNYYANNTCASRSLIDAAIKNNVRHFIFSSTAAIYGGAGGYSIAEDVATSPITPYGWSKLMTEIMLQDAGAAHGLKYAILRYFNVAGADPLMRTGQSTPGATHLIKVAVQAALGIRAQLEVFGTDFPTSDGSCIRDYIHVTDLVRAHSDAVAYLRGGGESAILNCGYGRGFSVFDVVRTVQAVSKTTFPVVHAAPRKGDAIVVVAASEKIRNVLGWSPQFDNLETIVAHSYAWERKLTGR